MAGLAELCGAFLAEELADSPVRASHLGAEGYDDRLDNLSTEAFAARIVVDTSLHMGEMGFDEAVRFTAEKANLPEPTARVEVARYCSWPTQAAAYLTGCLEIRAMRPLLRASWALGRRGAPRPRPAGRQRRPAARARGARALGLSRLPLSHRDDGAR